MYCSDWTLEDIQHSVDNYISMMALTHGEVIDEDERYSLIVGVQACQSEGLMDKFGISTVDVIDYLWRMESLINCSFGLEMFKTYVRYMREYLDKLNSDDSQNFKKLVKLYFKLDIDREAFARKVICNLILNKTHNSVDQVYKYIIEGVGIYNIGLVDSLYFKIPKRWTEKEDYPIISGPIK